MMKKTRLKNFLMITFGLIFFSACSTFSGSSVKLNFPEHEKLVLENGVTLYFLKDNRLPYITLQAVLEGGASVDPKGKEGLAHLSFEMLKEGTKNRPGGLLRQAYSNLGTDLRVNIDKDKVSMATKALSKYSDPITHLFLETLVAPEFKAVAFDKVKKRTLSDLDRQKENSGRFAARIFYKYLYGPDHPYGMPVPGTKTQVEKIKLTDAQNFYAQYMQPHRLHVAMTGFYSEPAKKMLIEKLGQLPTRGDSDKFVPKTFNLVEETEKSAAETKTKTPTRIVFVDKPGLAQAEVRIGYQAIKRSDPDFVPLYVANSIIGGGSFSSRLMQEVRVKRGLVYGIYSRFTSLKEEAPFIVSASTRHEKIPELIQVVLQQLEMARLDGVTTEELKNQKSITLGQFPTHIETNESYIRQLMILNTYGFGEDYLQNYLVEVESTSLKKANEMLKKHLRNTDLLITILGSKSELTEDFEKMGFAVEYVDYKNLGL